jgi:hypothetical protein
VEKKLITFKDDVLNPLSHYNIQKICRLWRWDQVHAGGRVWRDGRYGSSGQYQRWRCVPPGCKGDSPECHFFQVQLPRKALGGVHGTCTECEREWAPGEGLPSARTDRFSLREKAEALVDMARGLTYRR